MSLPPLATTTLAIIINWVLDTARRFSRLFGEGGQKQAPVGSGQKKDARRTPATVILPLAPKVHGAEKNISSGNIGVVVERSSLGPRAQSPLEEGGGVIW